MRINLGSPYCDHYFVFAVAVALPTSSHSDLKLCERTYEMVGGKPRKIVEAALDALELLLQLLTKLLKCENFIVNNTLHVPRLP